MTKKVINFFSWGGYALPDPPLKSAAVAASEARLQRLRQVGCCRSLRKPDWNAQDKSAAVAASKDEDVGRPWARLAAVAASTGFGAKPPESQGVWGAQPPRIQRGPGTKPPEIQGVQGAKPLGCGG